MSRKVLVFGASGEIGGRIAKGCVEAGHKVYGVTRGQNSRATIDLDGVEMIHGDKNDENFVRDLGADLDYDAVIDSVPSIHSVNLYHQHMKKAENVLFCSSTGTFVPLQYFPADENHPWREKTPVNFFNQSERDAHALDLYKTDGFPATVLRPTNIIGSDRIPLELWGGRDIEFFKKLKANEPVMIPPCENVLLQSGSNTDLADAFVLALNEPEAIRGELYIISCKKAITLGQYLRRAMEYLGSKSEIQVVSCEELMKAQPEIGWTWGLEFLMEHMCFDIGKAERTFGYNPVKSAEDGLIDGLRWCEEVGIL